MEKESQPQIDKETELKPEDERNLEVDIMVLREEIDNGLSGLKYLENGVLVQSPPIEKVVEHLSKFEEQHDISTSGIRHRLEDLVNKYIKIPQTLRRQQELLDIFKGDIASYANGWIDAVQAMSKKIAD